MSEASATNFFVTDFFNFCKARFTLYGQIFSIGIQSTLVYRWNFFLRTVMNFLPLVVSLFLWKAVFAGKSSFHGYNYSLMIAYFLSMIVLDVISSTRDLGFQIAEEIKEGRISQILLKPISYLSYRLSLYGSTRLVDFVVAIGPIMIVLFFLRSYFIGIEIGHTFFPAFIAAIGSGLLQFAISYATAMLAFWLLEIGSALFIIYSFEFLAGGHIFPLDLLPAPLWRASMTLPFAYEYYFPVAVFIGRIQSWNIIWGLLTQIFWTLFFLLLGHSIWLRGLKKYTSVGG